MCKSITHTDSVPTADTSRVLSAWSEMGEGVSEGGCVCGREG